MGDTLKTGKFREPAKYQGKEAEAAKKAAAAHKKADTKKVHHYSDEL